MPSYDFNHRKITYHVELAKDPNFKDKILDKKGLTKTSVTTDHLPKGQYFMRVIATNSDGKSQAAFDQYRVGTTSLFGVLSFYVTEDGKIKVDVYESK